VEFEKGLHLTSIVTTTITAGVSYGFAAALTTFFREITFWQAFWISAPLTTAVMIIVALGTRGELNGWGAISIFVGTAVVCYFVGLTATHEALGKAWHTTACVPGSCNNVLVLDPRTIAENLVKIYWHLYGVLGFLGSVASGVVLGLRFKEG